MAGMHTPRRTVVWLTILSVVIALAVIQQRRADDATVELVDSALYAGANQQVAPAVVPEVAPAAAPAADLTPFSASITGPDDETISVCVQTINDAAEFAMMELHAANPIQTSEPSDERFRAELENLQRSSAASRDPGHLLTAFLLDRPEFRASNDPTSSATLLELGLRAGNSDSPLLAWHALRACLEAEVYCPFPPLEQDLLEADSDNAEAWALMATLRYRRGDVAGALAAMQDAAQASMSTWYLGDTIALVERSLAEQTAITYADRVGLGFGVAASTLPSQSSLLNMCRVESAASRAWAEACLAFGAVRGEHNETTAARSIAYPIREQALTALGDMESAAEVAAESALFNAERTAGGLELTGSRLRVLEVLVTTDPERLHAYLSAIQQFGESEGVRVFLRQELPPLLDRAGLLDRDGARECVAQFFEPPAAVGTRSATFQSYRVQDYPIQVGDQLQMSVRGQGALTTSLRVGPDGKITMPRVLDVEAVGKTTEQLQREITTILSERYQSPEVFVILVSPRTPEELGLEFDNALREATERRDESR